MIKYSVALDQKPIKLTSEFSTLVSGVDIGVEELRSVGRSVTRRTLSKWHGDNDLTRQEETVMELLKDNPWAHFSVRGKYYGLLSIISWACTKKQLLVGLIVNGSY